ncbi:MAG TPA: TonB-dependent receptor [Verrucomicrobiae bacterium]|nr:TonB-dependent receptor [Verrucomicrobiae bacterium]
MTASRRAALALVLFPHVLNTQIKEGSWSGVLRDQSGAAIGCAILRLAAGSTHLSAATDKEGHFSFPAIPSGEYSLAIESRGAIATYATRLQLPDSRPAAIVLGSAGAISFSAAEQREGTGGQHLSNKEVSGLPLNKRDFSQLLLLAAGTMTDTNGAANFTQQFAVNGQRGTAAVFAMDGVDISDPEMGGGTFTNFNVDAVAEIRSSSGWMPAEIGRGAAGYTDIVTRSGSNELHGSVFEFLRNAALDARNFFDRRSFANPGRIPPFVRNEFGFTNGGPVVIPGVYNGRNRTYYFGQYQGFRQVLGTTQVLSVPTAAERAGKDTTAYPGDTLYVPVDPAIAKLISRYPLPNDPQGAFGARTYATSSKVKTVTDQFSARIDHSLNDKTKLFFRINVDNIEGPTTNPSQTALDPSFAVEYQDRQRNAAFSVTRSPSPNFTSETSVSFTRTTPIFPANNHTDPALKFGDSLYEPFNNAAGSVTGSYGNLFQVRQNFTHVRGRHTIRWGGEWRGNRDTTVYGISPNGEYQFGGGAAYSPVEIRSASGLHDIHLGDPLPDSLTGLLTASAFTYNLVVAPPMFPQGDHIGDAGIRRDAYNLYVQDSWKIGDRLLLNCGLRYEMTTRIRERSAQTSTLDFDTSSGKPAVNLLINPDPAYKWDPAGFGPRLGVEWRVAKDTLVRAGAGITTILINLWQNNALTGNTPFVVSPRLTAAPGQPIRFGMTITPEQLPTVYTTSGQPVFATGDSKQVPGNTIMDVQRFEDELAALSPDHRIIPLNGVAISRDLVNGYIGTWTAGLEQKIRSVTMTAAYVGTAGVKLTGASFPNGYTGAAPAFARYTRFDSAGQITGGFGPLFVINNHAHSAYHAVQVSASKNLTSSGLGVQASYSWSKSIDDVSGVLSAIPAQDPFHTGLDRGPSSFDVAYAMSFSLFQDLHADRAPLLRRLGRTAMGGWQMLAIGSLNTGLPFTVLSGIQQTGVGAGGADRPDQTGTPALSTSRAVREDYFGFGDNNVSYFRIPIGVAGGTGPNDGRFGTLGRNTFRGPMFHNLDVAFIKDTPLAMRNGWERAALQFRAEFFNVFNLVNFGLPQNTLLGAGFGRITKTAGSSRQIQFSLKLIF